MDGFLSSLDSKSAANATAVGAMATIAEAVSTYFPIFSAEGIVPGIDPPGVGLLISCIAFSIFHRMRNRRRLSLALSLKASFLRNPQTFMKALRIDATKSETLLIAEIENQLQSSHISLEDAFLITEPLLIKKFPAESLHES